MTGTKKKKIPKEGIVEFSSVVLSLIPFFFFFRLGLAVNYEMRKGE